MSTKRFVNEHNVRAVVEYGEPNPDWDHEHNGWRVTLLFGRRRMTVPFYTGLAISGEPTVADVLECLALDASGYENARSFEEWCAEYNYDTDSRSAERTYRQVEQQTDKLRKFLGDKFGDLLREA